ncbi:hypothetical protein J4N42_20145 [Vibrio sp. SCSIO 43135]|uniref:hypothetical protein n=1 Tax=Vibrio sp. SCSIO 43135 TaxID=2819096 RepID=UPI0020756DDC|nr:hypothetical protein [Vibrio sp. SCSIO 43135]USD42923.1 hypothetical protein J4N42_20145 [Vibrio sp. SCSIO 43135]
MKRFFPSSVMLTPFLVKYYDETNDDQPTAQKEQTQQESLVDSEQKDATLEQELS